VTFDMSRFRSRRSHALITKDRLTHCGTGRPVAPRCHQAKKERRASPRRGGARSVKKKLRTLLGGLPAIGSVGRVSFTLARGYFVLNGPSWKVAMPDDCAAANPIRHDAGKRCGGRLGGLGQGRSPLLRLRLHRLNHRWARNKRHADASRLDRSRYVKKQHPR
jgi:hypothetical protein